MSLVSPAPLQHTPACRPFFDPRDARCKTPFGAVSLGETVTLTLRPV